MKKDGTGAKTILFVSCVSTLYGGERSLLEVINVMSSHLETMVCRTDKRTL